MKSWTDWLGIELSAVSYREKFVSLLGGFIAILCLILLTRSVLHLSGATAVIASMGASAVLLFAMPHGQLSQPWPVVAGHAFSALIGVLCARFIPVPEVAGALAVGLSIGAMHQFKCIHPPGGATALTAVLGGQAIRDLGFDFVLFPVLVNGLVMVGLAVAFNGAFGWRRYPAAWRKARVVSLEEERTGPSHDQIVAALKSLDSFVDVTEEDLIELCRILAVSKDKVTEMPEPARAQKVG